MVGEQVHVDEQLVLLEADVAFHRCAAELAAGVPGDLGQAQLAECDRDLVQPRVPRSRPPARRFLRLLFLLRVGDHADHHREHDQAYRHVPELDRDRDQEKHRERRAAAAEAASLLLHYHPDWLLLRHRSPDLGDTDDGSLAQADLGASLAVDKHDFAHGEASGRG